MIRDQYSLEDVRAILHGTGNRSDRYPGKPAGGGDQTAVIELIHHMNNVDSIVRKSDYLVEKMGLSYAYLSRIFSTHEHITLEKLYHPEQD